MDPLGCRGEFAVSDPAVPTGYGLYLLQTLLALGAVCALAYVVLRWGAKRLYGVGRPGQQMRLVERLPLDPRRSLYLVEVSGRQLLVGSSENGVTLLTEVSRDGPELVEMKVAVRAEEVEEIEAGEAVEGSTRTRPDQSPDPER